MTYKQRPDLGYTIAQVAGILGVPQRSIHEWVTTGFYTPVLKNFDDPTETAFMKEHKRCGVVDILVLKVGRDLMKMYPHPKLPRPILKRLLGQLAKMHMEGNATIDLEKGIEVFKGWTLIVPAIEEILEPAPDGSDNPVNLLLEKVPEDMEEDIQDGFCVTYDYGKAIQEVYDAIVKFRRSKNMPEHWGSFWQNPHPERSLQAQREDRKEKERRAKEEQEHQRQRRQESLEISRGSLQ